jgi:biopolymer transport protein TolQ
MDPIQAAPVAQGANSTDLWHLVMQASWPVFFVMIGLALASVWCWAVIFQKYYAFRNVKAADEKFEKAFWSGRSLEELYGALNNMPTIGMASIFVAAMEEWKRSQGAAMRAGFAGVQKRIEKVMDVAIQKEMGGLEARLLSLATTGSAGPFIGLFGTVVGIMISFQGIAASGQTSLAVVAPGIAEALFATAIGLVAAIPATIFYNIFSNDAAKVQSRLENFADEFSAIISRQLDERA